MSKNKLGRWLAALAILLSGMVCSGFAARWLKSVLSLPSITLEGRGAPSDLMEIVLMLPLFYLYLVMVTKLFRIDLNELGRMVRGE